jgi:hypothetical protein
MHSSELLLLAVILVPAIILFYFRINAAIVFLSLCLGNVLTQFVSPDAHQFLTLFSAKLPKNLGSGNNLIKILLLVLPPLLTAIFMLRTVKGNNKYINILPALGVGILIALLLIPLLSVNFSNTIIGSKYWLTLKNNQAALVGLSSLASLVTLWLERPKTSHSKSKHQ